MSKNCSLSSHASQIQALIDEAYSPDTPAPDAPWKRMMSDIVARSCGESDAVGYGPKAPYGIKFTYPNQPPEWVEMAMAQDPITGQVMFWNRSTRDPPKTLGDSMKLKYLFPSTHTCEAQVFRSQSPDCFFILHYRLVCSEHKVEVCRVRIDSNQNIDHLRSMQHAWYLHAQACKGQV